MGGEGGGGDVQAFQQEGQEPQGGLRATAAATADIPPTTAAVRPAVSADIWTATGGRAQRLRHPEPAQPVLVSRPAAHQPLQRRVHAGGGAADVPAVQSGPVLRASFPVLPLALPGTRRRYSGAKEVKRPSGLRWLWPLDLRLV
ncbi:uncharacterized protein LOC119578750 [Penaeus monodon]|uniref:uncharacterized protein LOC119578750 n=1 Tax=Penaeus monodon TaxID=6687 RepID=UPI0018A71064|nr:uncharacterized protein LOC119578750 [Penaeus monodon]